jgi:branched-chain amino acid transport system ATP-binding protein
MSTPPGQTGNRSLLSVEDLTVGYGHVSVLEQVSLEIAPGSIVALVGSNGAGKSTMLRAISGLLRPQGGRILLDGRNIAGARPDRIVEAGVLHVAEGRRLFRQQTVMDNLELGLYRAAVPREAEAERYHRIFELFPALAERRSARAGVLSGGQQQMLAIAQALMREPRLLMLDEPSLGLAPVLVDEVLGVIARMRNAGTAVLLVEQMVERALEVADRGYVLQNGRIIGEGTPRELASGDLIRRAYIAATPAREV